VLGGRLGAGAPGEQFDRVLTGGHHTAGADDASVADLLGRHRGEVQRARRLRSSTFADVTALLLSCVEPTLLDGSFAAAYEVPESATNKARWATPLWRR